MRKVTREWLDFAQTDLGAAEHLLTMWPVPREIICYHCHQSAEKALKGILVEHDMEPPKTHNLSRLCGMCESYVSSFAEIRETCEELVPFATKLRYPEAHDVTVETMNAALRGSHTVLDFVLSILEEGAEE